ncbi:acyl-CoA N-acyltransferase, partial [Hypoxylon crocopeplum]
MMFPQSDTIQAQRDEIIRWYAVMLEDAFQDRLESFLKLWSIDGTPVGFCGWTIERNREQIEVNDSQANEQPKKEMRKKQTWIPKAIDIDGWTTLSRALRTERDQVLKNLDNICRLTFMAVNPEYQRQGIGSMMMQRICEETDQHGRCAYVLAAPDGVRLYAKFGFETVGRVETSQGTITSMLRPSRQS